MIILACQHVLVESGMHGLGSYASPVVPERGGKKGEKPPRSGRRRPRLDPHTPLSDIIAASPIGDRVLA
jgi:hypothetical protein